MGGCRCSYRTCKQSSDGHTHFFHYPVFNKVRCHQWIVNACRNDLLDLKLSQLKNRVICQHHFTDDMFMNFKKEKLIHNAVPTEDGPFLEPTSSCTALVQKEIDDPAEISVDDSRFFTPREKIATFSVPYNQFLRKCSFDTINDPGLRKSLTPKKKSRGTPGFIPMLENNENAKNFVNEKNSPPQPQTTRVPQIPQTTKAPQNSQTARSPQNPKTTRASQNLLTISAAQNPQTTRDPQTPQITRAQQNPQTTSTPQSPQSELRRAPKRNKNIVILSEKKITEPITVHLQNITQPVVLKTPKNRLKSISAEIPQIHVDINVRREENDLQYILGQDSGVMHPGEYPVEIIQQATQPITEEENNSLPQIVNLGSSEIDNSHLLHPSSIPIEFVPGTPLESLPTGPVSFVTPDDTQCLQSATERTITLIGDERPVNKSSLRSNNNRLSSTSKSKHSCRNPRKMSSLSAALLAKVSENSRDIAEIKNLLLQQSKSQPVVKQLQDKSVGHDIVARKKYMYDELSQYLSTKLKSDLFEELFLIHPKRNKKI